MEGQETLEHMVVEYETIVDEDGYEEEEEEELYDCENDFEPSDLADQAYEQWRDEEEQYVERLRQIGLVLIILSQPIFCRFSLPGPNKLFCD